MCQGVKNEVELFGRHLPSVRNGIRPIYRQLGMLPELAPELRHSVKLFVEADRTTGGQARDPWPFVFLPWRSTRNYGKEIPMTQEVEKALDSIRPALQADGGNVELVEVTGDGVVKVRLVGACGHCPMSTQTLKLGIERTLRVKVPGVTQVVSV